MNHIVHLKEMSYVNHTSKKKPQKLKKNDKLDLSNQKTFGLEKNSVKRMKKKS